MRPKSADRAEREAWKKYSDDCWQARLVGNYEVAEPLHWADLLAELKRLNRLPNIKAAA